MAGAVGQGGGRRKKALSKIGVACAVEGRFGREQVKSLLARATPFVVEVLGLVGEVGMEGKIEIVAGGVWDQPALWHEGVTTLREAYHGEIARRREIEERRGNRGKKR